MSRTHLRRLHARNGIINALSLLVKIERQITQLVQRDIGKHNYLASKGYNITYAMHYAFRLQLRGIILIDLKIIKYGNST